MKAPAATQGDLLLESKIAELLTQFAKAAADDDLELSDRLLADVHELKARRRHEIVDRLRVERQQEAQGERNDN